MQGVLFSGPAFGFPAEDVELDVGYFEVGDAVLRELHRIRLLFIADHNIIVVMFSHRLPYYAQATQAHLQAQTECFEKDTAIAQLRGDLTSRRRVDDDFQQLNDQIYDLEGKYDLLQAERERSSRDIKYL